MIAPLSIEIGFFREKIATRTQTLFLGINISIWKYEIVQGNMKRQLWRLHHSVKMAEKRRGAPTFLKRVIGKINEEVNKLAPLLASHVNHPSSMK